VRWFARTSTKRELLELVWPDTFVEEGILPVHISSLRKALDDGSDTSVIETVARSGYRFRGEVKAPPVSAAQEVFLKGMHSLSRMTRALMDRGRGYSSRTSSTQRRLHLIHPGRQQPNPDRR